MNKIKLRLEIFIKESFMFIASMAIGIFVASSIGQAQSVMPVHKVALSWQDFVIFGVVFALMTLILTKFKFFASGMFRVFLYLVILGGTQAVLGTMLSATTSFLGALILCFVVYVLKNVFIHNVAIILAIAGVSAVFGSNISPNVAVIILATMAVYDIIAVYRTKHMVQMAHTMLESGSIFGFIVPVHWKGFFASPSKVQPGQDFVILGSGDIGLPIILASSLATISLSSALITAFFSVIGLFVTHLAFVNQQKRAAMAALPPIATLSILGYLVSLLIL